VGIRLETNLGENRGAALPEVVVAAPDAQLWAYRLRVAREQWADAMGRHFVHIVPPRAADDHLLVHRQDGGALVVAVATVASEREGGVAFLAELGGAPE